MALLVLNLHILWYQQRKIQLSQPYITWAKYVLIVCKICIYCMQNKFSSCKTYIYYAQNIHNMYIYCMRNMYLWYAKCTPWMYIKDNPLWAKYASIVRKMSVNCMQRYASIACDICSYCMHLSGTFSHTDRKRNMLRHRRWDAERMGWMHH